jgi:hypothetical protein
MSRTKRMNLRIFIPTGNATSEFTLGYQSLLTAIIVNINIASFRLRSEIRSSATRFRSALSSLRHLSLPDNRIAGLPGNARDRYIETSEGCSDGGDKTRRAATLSTPTKTVQRLFDNRRDTEESGVDSNAAD